MNCIKHLLSYCNFYYYSNQVQATKINDTQYIIINHYTKEAQIYTPQVDTVPDAPKLGPTPVKNLLDKDSSPSLISI